MRPQQYIVAVFSFLNKKGVLHVAGRMVGGKVECGEVVPVVFNFGAFGHGKPDSRKNRQNPVSNYRKRMPARGGIKPHGQGQVVQSSPLVVSGMLLLKVVEAELRFLFQLVQQQPDFSFVGTWNLFKICKQII